MVLAKVIFSEEDDSAVKNKSIFINKGSGDGIQKGMAAVSGEGVVVGKVVDVKANMSKICLVVDQDCKFAASIKNYDKTAGIVQGELGLTAKMDLIPQTEDVKVGDIVVTSGLEQFINEGLVIGKVSEVKKENNELWQNATIETLVNLDNLKIVSVLFQSGQSQ